MPRANWEETNWTLPSQPASIVRDKMTRYQDPAERDRAKDALLLAILNDGEGFGFYKDTGKYLWEPDERAFNSYWYKNAWTYSMGATDPQIIAYWRLGKVVVTHNGQERHLVHEKWG